MYDKNKIISYINNVCVAACKSENRPIDIEYQFSFFEDNIFVFALKCKYDRVTRRIKYRLYRNFERNFPGLVFNDVTFDVRNHCIDECCCTMVGFDEMCIDFNHAVSEWIMFGKWGTLAYYMRSDKINPHLENENGQNRYLYMVDHGFEYFNVKEGHNDWVKFCSEYERIFEEKLPVQPDTIECIKLSGNDVFMKTYAYCKSSYCVVSGNEEYIRK